MQMEVTKKLMPQCCCKVVSLNSTKALCCSLIPSPEFAGIIFPWGGFLCFSVFSLVENKGCNLFYHPLNFHPPLPNVPTFAQKSSKSHMDFLPSRTDFCPLDFSTLTINLLFLWSQTAKVYKNHGVICENGRTSLSLTFGWFNLRQMKVKSYFTNSFCAKSYLDVSPYLESFSKKL